MKSPDIIIVGAGLMGAATALNLARYGKRVVILEKEKAPCHASAVNAGGVRQLNRAVEEIPVSVAAMDLWERMPDWLGDHCGFRPVGQVRIAPDASAMALFADRAARVRAMGFPHEELVDESEVRRLVPAYEGPCCGGIVSRRDGFALPARTLKAFLAAARRAGAAIFPQTPVTGITRGAQGLKVVTGRGQAFRAEVVINCAGAWAGSLAAACQDKIPMEPTALSMMVTARMPRFLTPVIGVHGRKLSFKQMDNGTVVIGGAHRAFLDMDREKTRINFSEMRQSARTVLAHFPAMKRARVVRTWAGIEGITADNLPVIDASPSVPGLFHVCGFSAHGFQLSPVVGKLAAALATGRTPALSLGAFSLNRFDRQAWADNDTTGDKG